MSPIVLAIILLLAAILVMVVVCLLVCFCTKNNNKKTAMQQIKLAEQTLRLQASSINDLPTHQHEYKTHNHDANLPRIPPEHELPPADQLSETDDNLHVNQMYEVDRYEIEGRSKDQVLMSVRKTLRPSVTAIEMFSKNKKDRNNCNNDEPDVVV